MRLIDAERLMYSLRGNVLIDVTTELEETIAEQPTAFDWSEFDDEDAFGEMNAYKNAIEIVEKGGIE